MDFQETPEINCEKGKNCKEGQTLMRSSLGKISTHRKKEYA